MCVSTVDGFGRAGMERAGTVILSTFGRTDSILVCCDGRKTKIITRSSNDFTVCLVF